MSLLTQTYSSHNHPYLQIEPNSIIKEECGRLIMAAVVSRSFRDQLLSDPVKSIEAGYGGEKFRFTSDEKECLKTIHAHTLEDFSAQLIQVIEKRLVPAGMVCVER